MNTKPTQLAFACLLIVLATTAAYFPVFSAGFIWDDSSVTDNPLLRDGVGLARIWVRPWENPFETHYWPVTYTTFWFEARLWGMNPAGYHTVNLALHIVNALLLLLFLRCLGIPSAVTAVFLFGLHPVRVESVAWVIERKDVLSGFFWLLAANVLVAWLDRRRADLMVLFHLLFILAMLSKSVAVTLPVTLGALLLWRRPAHRTVLLRNLIPALVMGLAFAVIDARYAAWRESFSSGVPLPERLLIAPRALWHYLGKSLWPSLLVTHYERWPLDGGWSAAGVFLAALPGVAALLWIARRSAMSRAALAAGVFFIVTLSPMLGFFDFSFLANAFVADRFQYLAGIAPVMLAAWVFGSLTRRGGRRAAACGRGLTILCCLGLGLATLAHARHYHDPDSVFDDTLRKNPLCWIGLIREGAFAGAVGRDEPSLKTYRDALVRNSEMVEAQNALAVKEMDDGDLESARGRLEQIVAAGVPGASHLNNLGMVRLRMGDTTGSLEVFRLAALTAPEDAEVATNLGTVLLQTGDLPGALAELERAVRLRPDLAGARNSLGIALAGAGRTAEAIAEFERALELDPSFARASFNLGAMHLRHGDAAEAVRYLEKTIALDPKYPGAKARLEEARGKLGQSAR